MTIHIGILEDEPAYANTYKDMILSWSREHVPCNIMLFHDGDSLCQSVLKNDHFDILFLDIQLRSERNGVQVAHKLREYGYAGTIVFVTASESFWKAGYDVGAYQYFLKPLTNKQLAQCLCFVAAQLSERKLYVTAKGSQYQIPFYDILYLSTLGHYTTIHTTNEQITTKKPLRSFIPELPHYFHQCHRSFLVNLYHVYRFEGNTLLLDNGQTLYISKNYISTIRRDFLQLSNVL